MVLAGYCLRSAHVDKDTVLRRLKVSSAFYVVVRFDALLVVVGGISEYWDYSTKRAELAALNAPSRRSVAAFRVFKVFLCLVTTAQS